ncbi:hypothetical protein CPB86DRAFT_802503 [Serendipita vermifera]|nr:hypothetical protein CPB86DRAFT_802503 [Serendipita vermifera]
MSLQLTDVFIGSITPSHPHLAKSPSLFLQVAVDGKPLASIRALTVDANSGIWELESDLDIPPNAQMLSFDIVRYDEKKLVSATLEVSTLLKRVKADSKECYELSTCESCSAMQIIVSFFVKQPKPLAIERSPHQVNRSRIRNEGKCNTVTPKAQDKFSLPTREELRSRYANIINLPNTEPKAKVLNAIGAVYHQHYRTSGTKTDLDEAIHNWVNIHMTLPQL